MNQTPAAGDVALSLSDNEKRIFLKRLIADFKEEEFFEEVRREDVKERAKGGRGYIHDDEVGVWVLERPTSRLENPSSPLSRGKTCEPPDFQPEPGLHMFLGWGDRRRGEEWRRLTAEEEAQRPRTVQDLTDIFRKSRSFASAEAVSAEIEKQVAIGAVEIEKLKQGLANNRENLRLSRLAEEDELAKSGFSREEVAEAEKVLLRPRPEDPPPPLTENQRYFSYRHDLELIEIKVRQNAMTRERGEERARALRVKWGLERPLGSASS